MQTNAPAIDRSGAADSDQPGRQIKIMLADPPALEDDYDKAYPNLGLLQLIASLRANTFLKDEDIIFLDQFHRLEDHIRAIEEHRPAIYGISFAFLVQRCAYATINAIKERFPDILVIAGGPHPSSAPADVLRKTKADLVCIGEGERFIEEAVEKIAHSDGDFSNVKGIALWEEGKIRFTEPRPVIRDLDAEPYMAWDRIDFSKFIGQHYCKSKRQSCIVVSRGCPHKCTFCSLPVWRVSKPFVRMRSPENIAREVDWLYRLGVREIKIVSDEINVTLPWAKEVCRAIADLGHQDLYFQSNLRADNVDDELAGLFKEMNMWLVHLGCESANDRVLNGIQKKITVRQVEDCTEFLKKHGIKVLLFMMTFNIWEEDGEIQCETPKEVRRSLRFVWSQFLKRRISYTTWSTTTPMPGSPLYEIVRRHGLEPADQVLGNWGRNKDYLGIDLTPFGISERTKMRMLRWGIISKGCFALTSGGFDWRRNFYRVGILFRTFFGKWDRVAACKSKPVVRPGDVVEVKPRTGGLSIEG